jgi:hypothetical protein
MIFVKIGELLFISSLLISFEAEFTVRNELCAIDRRKLSQKLNIKRIKELQPPSSGLFQSKIYLFND